jgi:hypothetical protein
MKEGARNALLSLSYRDDLGAALERIHALEAEKDPPVPKPALPAKDELFRGVRGSFASEPGRWTPRTIVVEHGNSMQDGARDGWVRDFSAGHQAFGIYLTGLWWIRIGTVLCGSYGTARAGMDRSGWVYIFCPRFRRMVRKHRNWRLLRDLEG